MRRAARLLGLTFILLASASVHHAVAQNRAGSFQGKWSWAIIVKDKNDLPRGFRDMKPEEVPQRSLDLDFKQKGNRLTGTCSATANFTSKVEDGDISTTVRGNVAYVQLESGFGGKMTARITLRGNRLYWKIIKSEGEHYFPNNVVLRRDR